MAFFQVTSSELRNKASRLQELNSQFKAKAAELGEKETSLCSMWEGEAKNVFHQAFLRDRQQMEAFYQLIGVGSRDVVVIPSISDFTGLNMMTRTILSNACACVAGMALFAGNILSKPKRPVVGVSLMGITNEGCCAAINELDRLGIESVGFHSTGVGGAVMEKLALDGLLDGILDMTTHEITSEYFGGGFSYGARNRLTKTVEAGIPMVVSVGGLDFVDFDREHFPPRMDQRVYNMHNATLAHIKILPDEAVEVGTVFADRLNRSTHPLRLVFPTEGMRKNTRQGGNLYCPETDTALLGTIRSRCGEQIRIVDLEGNLNDVDWGQRIAHIMADELKAKGIM